MLDKLYVISKCKVKKFNVTELKKCTSVYRFVLTRFLKYSNDNVQKMAYERYGHKNRLFLQSLNFNTLLEMSNFQLNNLLEYWSQIQLSRTILQILIYN